MAHFYGTVRGKRGLASRLGTKDSGLSVTANGWTTGATVSLGTRDGVDVVLVYKTDGSNGGNTMELVAEWCENECKGLATPHCEQCKNRFRCHTTRKE